MQSNKLWLLGCVILLSVLVVMACRKKSPKVSLDQLQGGWQRLDSDKPQYDGMKINVLGGQAAIVAMDSNRYFQVGNLLWRNIQPKVDSTYSLEVLGSDQQYYSATMTLTRIDEWYVRVVISTDYTTYGTSQWWLKLP